MKKNRIFPAVVYFIFTFGIGVVFALTLPGYFATFSVPAEVISEALAGGDLVTALVLTEPVAFFREPALACEFDRGGFVLYETVAEVYDRSTIEGEVPEGTLTHGMLYPCYTAYLYGVEGEYDVYSRENNKTSMTVTDADGKETVLPLLDYDDNGDGANDGISTFTQSGFILIEIRAQDVSSVRTVSFTDRTGNKMFTAEAQKDLSFRSAFFDCFGDIAGYNDLVARGDANDERNAYVDEVAKKLAETDGCELTSRSEEYAAAARLVGKRANAKAIPFIIVYFVAVYIIADFLLGTHFIIRFFKWFLFKVCKIRRKGKSSPPKDEVFGHDYYSMVTLSLDLSEAPEFCGSVEIKYSAEGEEFAFHLLKSEGYTATLRMKAGVYVNPFIDIDRAYAPVDLPENLEVEGYRTEKTVKIVRREV